MLHQCGCRDFKYVFLLEVPARALEQCSTQFRRLPGGPGFPGHLESRSVPIV